MTYATKYNLLKLKKAASQPAGWLTAFEQSDYFFSKKNDKNIKFWLLDNEVNRDLQNGRIVSSQRSILHFNGRSLRLEQRNLI